jgi:general stress protein 26
MQNGEQKFWKLIGDMHVCMLATLSGNVIHSRPMHAVARPDYGDIVMLTDKHLAKDNEIERNHHITLTYSDGSTTFVSVQGTVEVSTDRTIINDVWSPAAKIYWPDGQDDPSIVALVVTPHNVEYWDGDNKLVSGIKIAYGLATHSTPTLGENKKLHL